MEYISLLGRAIIMTIFSLHHQFGLLQFFLISPLDPVSGLISPILIIAAAKSELKVLELLAYVLTKESVDPPLNKI